MKTLKLTLAFNDDINTTDADKMFTVFATKYPTEITEFCNINDDTEYQLDNFGLGSAWLFESPYQLGLTFSEDDITLTITK